MSFELKDDQFKNAFNAQLQADSHIDIKEVKKEDGKVSFTMIIPTVNGGFKEVKVSTEDKRVLGQNAGEVEKWVEEQVAKIKAFREQEIASLVTWQDKPNVVQIKMAGDTQVHTFKPGEEVAKSSNDFQHVAEIHQIEQKIHKLVKKSSKKEKVGELTRTIIAKEFQHEAAKVAADIFMAAHVTLPAIDIGPDVKLTAILSRQIGPTEIQHIDWTEAPDPHTFIGHEKKGAIILNQLQQKGKSLKFLKKLDSDERKAFFAKLDIKNDLEEATRKELLDLFPNEMVEMVEKGADLKIEELLILIHSPKITPEALEKAREFFDKKPESRKLMEIRFLLDKKDVSINARDEEHMNISEQSHAESTVKPKAQEYINEVLDEALSKVTDVDTAEFKNIDAIINDTRVEVEPAVKAKYDEKINKAKQTKQSKMIVAALQKALEEDPPNILKFNELAKKHPNLVTPELRARCNFCSAPDYFLRKALNEGNIAKYEDLLISVEPEDISPEVRGKYFFLKNKPVIQKDYAALPNYLLQGVPFLMGGKYASGSIDEAIEDFIIGSLKDYMPTDAIKDELKQADHPDLLKRDFQTRGYLLSLIHILEDNGTNLEGLQIAWKAVQLLVKNHYIYADDPLVARFSKALEDRLVGADLSHLIWTEFQGDRAIVPPVVAPVVRMPVGEAVGLLKECDVKTDLFSAMNALFGYLNGTKSATEYIKYDATEQNANPHYIETQEFCKAARCTTWLAGKIQQQLPAELDYYIGLAERLIEGGNFDGAMSIYFALNVPEVRKQIPKDSPNFAKLVKIEKCLMSTNSIRMREAMQKAVDKGDQSFIPYTGQFLTDYEFTKQSAGQFDLIKEGEIHINKLGAFARVIRTCLQLRPYQTPAPVKELDDFIKDTVAKAS